MRLFVKYEDKLAEIFNVFFRKSQHRSVIGEYILFPLLENLIQTGKNFHSHFIYVENGNYHFSIKYFDTADNQFVDRKTYHSHISEQRGPTADLTKITPVTREKNLEDILDSFMMNSQSKAWDDKTLGHSFNTIALQSNAITASPLIWDENLIVKNDDLVIDLIAHPDCTINFGAYLYNESNTNFAHLDLPSNVIAYTTCEKQDDLVLQLSVIISHNETK